MTVRAPASPGEQSIAWVLPDAEHDDEALLAPLRGLGFRIQTCVPGTSREIGADLRVMQADLFADVRRLRREYLVDDTPTLVIVSRVEQEVGLLEFLKPRDDVVRGAQPIELIALRLLRLTKNAGGELLLANLASRDELTGLVNRKHWQAQVAQAFEQTLPDEARAVVLFDLDHFKRINDRFGHAVGDQLLRETAALLKAGAAPGDLLCRWGGEEFAALVTRYDRETIVADIERLLARLAAHAFEASAAGDSGNGAAAWAAANAAHRGLHRFDESAPMPLDPTHPSRIPVTASAGLAFVEPHASFADVMNQADVALYEAKSKGRNRLVRYETLQDGSAVDDRDLYIRHFENVTRVMTERMTTLVTTMGRSLVEAARREANQDALTQLHNRRYFDARLTREFETSRKHGRSLSLALIDLDRFHDVNAAFGHPTGDHVLRRFADIARHCVRLTDWIARYGGEEFCLVMPDTELEMAANVAERIRRQVEATPIMSLDHRLVALTVSVGVARVELLTETPVALVQAASYAVLEAKRRGRNQLVVVS